eukprot:15296055-Ditylum_brightwellii.AAC.1
MDQPLKPAGKALAGAVGDGARQLGARPLEEAIQTTGGGGIIEELAAVCTFSSFIFALLDMLHK